MKQPKIILFNKTWDVTRIEWLNGEIDFIFYDHNGWSRLVIEGEVDKPKEHPKHKYILVPSIEEILVFQ